MKLNKKVVDLISEGFTAKTLKKLTESQIDRLHERIIEQLNTANPIASSTEKKEKVMKLKPNSKLPVDDKTTVISQGGVTTIKKEIPESKKKKKVNPWAVCTDSVGREDKKKYERCIQDVKKKNKGNLDLEEEKLNENLFIEKKILNLVEKYTTPKMSKKQFLSLLETKTKEKPNVDEAVMDAPAKPKEPTTKPGTKTPPREKPHDPFKPAPHKQPKPKAGKKLPDQLKFSAIGIKFKK